MNLLFLNIGTTEFFFILLPLLCVFIYTLYHAIINKNLTNTERIIWIALIFFANGLGILAYWIFRKKGSSDKKLLQ